MKYWETEHRMPLPWPEVASGYWWRYPNPSSSHVFSVDTLDTRLEGDKLYARRLIMKTNSLPSWGKHFFPDARVAVIEEVIVDRYEEKKKKLYVDNDRQCLLLFYRSQTELVWYTRNIGLRRFMGTEERATLSQAEEDGTVRVRKQCWIDSSIVGFRSAIKNFGVGRYQKNCGPATRGFQTVVEEKMRQDKERRGEGQSVISRIHGSQGQGPGGSGGSKGGQGLSVLSAVTRWQCGAEQRVGVAGD